MLKPLLRITRKKKIWLNSAQLPLQTLGQGFNIVSELSDHFWGRTPPSSKTHESWWNDLPIWKPPSCKRCWLPRYFLVGSRLQTSEKPNCLKNLCWIAGFWRQSNSNPSIRSKWEGSVAKLLYVGLFGHWKVAKRCHLQAQTYGTPPRGATAPPQAACCACQDGSGTAGHAQVLWLHGADWLVLDPGTLLGRNGVKSQLGRSSGYCLLQPELFPAHTTLQQKVIMWLFMAAHIEQLVHNTWEISVPRVIFSDIPIAQHGFKWSF